MGEIDMSTTHTPGPWTLQPIGDETECNILGAGRELIATVSDNDAPLIAAAPDLLAALEALTATARTFRNVPKREQEWTPIDDEALAAAFAAVAKARGA